MKLRVRVTPEAEADIAEAFDWYEEAQQDLGTRFLEAVRDAATLVGDNPEMFAPVHAEFRRVLLHVFPYSLFYDFSGGQRGKYAKRFEAGSNVVVLDPDVASEFKTRQAVNDALREQLQRRKSKEAG